MPVYLTVLLYPVRLLVLECSAVGPRFLFVDLHRVLRGGGFREMTACLVTPRDAYVIDDALVHVEKHK